MTNLQLRYRRVGTSFGEELEKISGAGIAANIRLAVAKRKRPRIKVPAPSAAAQRSHRHKTFLAKRSQGVKNSEKWKIVEGTKGYNVLVPKKWVE